MTTPIRRPAAGTTPSTAEATEQIAADLSRRSRELVDAIRAHSFAVETFTTSPRIVETWLRVLTAMSAHIATVEVGIEAL